VVDDVVGHGERRRQQLRPVAVGSDHVACHDDFTPRRAAHGQAHLEDVALEHLLRLDGELAHVGLGAGAAEALEDVLLANDQPLLVRQRAEHFRLLVGGDARHDQRTALPNIAIVGEQG
jgi:hypothetical protein